MLNGVVMCMTAGRLIYRPRTLTGKTKCTSALNWQHNKPDE